MSNSDTEAIVSGTSFATPHVTGTVALLQQYADQKIPSIGGPRWTANARHHEVMKAILLNSADKIQDTGNGKLLGMERTALDKDNKTWLQSEAYLDIDGRRVLDDQMGAGHLNAKRALTQFKTGEFESSVTVAVPQIGWDYGTTDGGGDINKYLLNGSIAAGQYISMTLAWDRRIQFAFAGGDANSNGEYDATFNPSDIDEVTSTDSFQGWGNAPENSFNRMFLYLMPAGATDVTQAIAKS